MSADTPPLQPPSYQQLTKPHRRPTAGKFGVSRHIAKQRLTNKTEYKVHLLEIHQYGLKGYTEDSGELLRRAVESLFEFKHNSLSQLVGQFIYFQ